MKSPFKILLLLTVLYCALSGTAWAQGQNSAKTYSVRGTVVDEGGMPAVGASILVVGRTGMGTVADEKGAFSITVPAGSVLAVSYVGYAEQTRTINRDVLDWFVQLEVDENFLEDAVVVGYGTQKKESIVGAISSVSSEQLSNTGTQDLKSALSGKVSGLLMTNPSGAPGSREVSSSMMLRGLSTFSGSNSPLVMVDGVERSLDDLNPDEVQSISVLKDASATAVFGSKGANGVIIVTTKSGSEGRAKMHVRADYGVTSPLYLPAHINAETTLNMANIAYRNDQSYSAQYAENIIQQYRDGSNPWRYPDTDWYRMMMRPIAPSYNASFDISGGSKKIKYYALGSYYHDDSLLRQVNFNGPVTFESDRINYRLNMTAALTKTTELSLRFGGSVTITSQPSGTTQGGVFNTMYMSTGLKYPAYWPEDIYELYPDPNYPDAHGVRLSNNAGQNYENPYRYVSDSQWNQYTTYRILSDLVLNQKLDFITKGLSAKAMISLTSTFERTSQTGSQTVPRWDIDWNRYDAGVADIWNSSSSDVTQVYVTPPLSVSQSMTANSVGFVHYIEGALNYARKFGHHDVTAMTVYNQRQYNSGTSSPHRNQSLVGRVTYNYMQKYLFEANIGITGSEQFAPQYRYGIFPSVAVGYTISREKFWKRALPWWNTMKVRFSWGLVGSDSSTSGFLYYTAYGTVSSKVYGSNTYYREGSAANNAARWETADKKDLGFEMGFFKDRLNLNVDLFDEYRYDILMSPVVTPLVGVQFKDTNSGSLKKHGIDIDLLWRDSLKNGWHYSVGVLVGLNENRIIKYADIPYNPEYKKYAGTPVNSQRTGSTLVDDKYFQNINQIHGYPAYTASWTNLIPGVYKFMDYKPDGILSDEDLHVLAGSSYPPCSYSLNFSLGYKGFTFRAVGTGTAGKKIQFKRGYIIPFLSGDLTVHPAALDYWTPTNRLAAAPTPTFLDQMYAWAGGNSNHPGFNLALGDYTWRNSDYFNIQELYFGYKFDGKKLRQRLGIDGLTVSLTANNFWMFTNLIEGNPQIHNTATSYYPLTRTTKLGVSINF